MSRQHSNHIMIQAQQAAAHWLGSKAMMNGSDCTVLKVTKPEKKYRNEGVPCCPTCNISFVGKEIPDGLMDTGGYKSRQEAEKAAEGYGWTPENKLTFTVNVVLHKAVGRRPDFWKCSGCGRLLTNAEYYEKSL